MKPQTAVELSRQIASQIWRGEQIHIDEPVSGLNCETTVRARLRNILLALEINASELDEDAYQTLISIDIIRDRPQTILEKSEAMLNAQISESQAVDGALDEGGTSANSGLRRLIVCQSIAARMGVWAARPDERDDSDIAQKLFSQATERIDDDLESRRSRAQEFYQNKAYRDAIIYFVAADQMQRSVEGLFKMSICLWKEGYLVAALWAIRACLLEDLSAFPSAKWLLKAQMVESNLKSLATPKHAGPVAADRTVIHRH